MGYGELEKIIKEYEGKYSNIHFQPAVKPEQVILYTRSADVGLAVFKNACLSYYYSLPNKLFEYILSGIPLIVSDFPEMAKFVDDKLCGWKVIPEDGALYDLIANITLDDAQIKKMNVRKIMNNYEWGFEGNTLLSLYKKLINVE